MAKDEIVCAAKAANSAEAALWQHALEAEGVQCKVVGGHLEAIIGEIPPGQTELWVRRVDLERAQAILAARRGG